MKTYVEVTENVIRRTNEYEAVQKKKRKVTTSLIAVFCLLIMVSTGAVAGYYWNNPIPEGGIFKNKLFNDKIKVFEYADDTVSKESIKLSKVASDKTKLEYSTTIVHTNIPEYDVYVDKDNNKYKYDGSGELIGFTSDEERTDTVIGTNDKKCDEPTVLELAHDYKKMFFSSKTEDFEVDSVLYLESENSYTVTFVKKFGEDKFIIGPYCFVEILPDLSLRKISLVRYNDYNDFDFNKLNGITKQDIIDFALNQIKTRYPEKTMYQIESISLDKKNENYFIKIIINVTMHVGNSNDTTSILDEVYYNF